MTKEEIHKDLRNHFGAVLDAVYLHGKETPDKINNLPPGQLTINDGLVKLEKLFDRYALSVVGETNKAFGGCEKCYGKGYATVQYGIQGFEDFGNDGFVAPIRTNMHFCTCERGKQLEKLISI